MKLFSLLALSFCMVAFVGCQAEKKEDGKKDDGDKKTNVSAPIAHCSKCGEEAGSEKCCDDSVASCECGFHEGTDLCCNKGKIKPTEEKGTYCSCGFTEGSEKCCKSDDMCSCGYAHGSEMCTAKCGEHDHKD